MLMVFLLVYLHFLFSLSQSISICIFTLTSFSGVSCMYACIISKLEMVKDRVPSGL